MSHYLKPSQEETNLVFAIKNLTISTEGYVHFLLMQNIKKFNDLNPGTGFDIEHVFFSHWFCPACPDLSNQITNFKPRNDYDFLTVV